MTRAEKNLIALLERKAKQPEAQSHDQIQSCSKFGKLEGTKGRQ